MCWRSRASRHSQSAARWLWWFGAVAAVLLGRVGRVPVHESRGPARRLGPAHPVATCQGGGRRASCSAPAAGPCSPSGPGSSCCTAASGCLMFSELYTAQQAVEAQMTIAEGETAYWAQDIRSVELAFTDVSDDDVDRSTVVPGRTHRSRRLARARPIRHATCPLAIRVVKFLPNVERRWLQPGEEPVATAGIGQLRARRRAAAGHRRRDRASRRHSRGVRRTARQRRAASRLGRYLVSPFFPGESVEVDGEPWELALRFTRIPKPYQVTLIDFKFDRYIGTDTPKNFESVVQFEDPGAQRRPHGLDLDEQPAALRRRHALSGRLGQGHRAPAPCCRS